MPNEFNNIRFQLSRGSTNYFSQLNGCSTDRVTILGRNQYLVLYCDGLNINYKVYVQADSSQLTYKDIFQGGSNGGSESCISSTGPQPTVDRFGFNWKFDIDSIESH